MIKELRQAIQILKKGGVVVYPTDTAYGLAVDATNLQAVKKLYKLKGRAFQNPIHVIPPNKAWLKKLVKINTPAKKIIDTLMPGPLTLVLPLKASGQAWRMISANTKTLGIRRPKHKIALDLAMYLNKPITTTSANISGKPAAYSVQEVKKQFQNASLKPDFYINGGKLRKIKPSTVVQVIKHVKILRPGPVTQKEIERVL